MPGGALVAIDLAIAFVGEDQEAEAPRQRGQPEEISRGRRRRPADWTARRYRTRRCARAGRRSSASRSGRKPVVARRRQIDRLAIGGDRAGRISGIERIGDEHGRPAGARRHPVLGGERGEKQSFARAVEHQHFGRRIDRALERVAAAEPLRDGCAELVEALVGRIAAEFVDMGGDHRPDKRRDRMLRLADREADRGLARREAVEQFAQPHERRARAGAREQVRRGRLAGHPVHHRQRGRPPDQRLR